MTESRRSIGSRPLRFDEPLDIEDIQEFHISRLLVLMRICGRGPSGLIYGRTKLAKLDFFVRYPRFLELGLDHLRTQGQYATPYSAGAEGVEASMIRYRYGPWDHRYFNLLSIMHARNLIRVGGGKVTTYSLTQVGGNLADTLIESTPFLPVVERCRIVADSFGRFSGTELKQFVYSAFNDEVASLAQGTKIDSPDARSGERA